MPKVRQANFASGELSPSLYGADYLEAYKHGSRTVRNLLASKQRTLLNRPGTLYCGEVKDSTKATRLLPFAFSNDQGYALEFGIAYSRIWRAAGTRLNHDGMIALANPTAWKSVDKGATWSQVTNAPLATYMASCQGADGRIIAVGHNAGTPVCAVSDDMGATWSTRTMPGTTPYGSIAYNGHTLLAMVDSTAAAGGISVSYDNGDTWLAVTSPPAIRAYIGNGLAWGRGMWVAVGTNLTGNKARWAQSPDGLTWSAPIAIADLDTAYPNGHVLSCVAFSGSVFYAGGFCNINATQRRYLWCAIGAGSRTKKEPAKINWSYGLTGTATTDVLVLRGAAGNGKTRVMLVGGNQDASLPYALMCDSDLGTVVELAPTGARMLFAVTYSQGYFLATGNILVKRYRDGGYGAPLQPGADPGGWESDPTPPAIGLYTVANVAGVADELVTPYAADAIANVKTAQTADVLSLFHRLYEPREIRRYSASDFRIEPWYKTPPTRVVTNLAFDGAIDQTGDANHAPKAWSWVCTWEDAETGVESLPSAYLSPSGSGKIVLYPDRPVAVKCGFIEKASRYHWYRGRNGEWGWVGSVAQPEVAAGAANPSTVSFNDDGQIPLLSNPPPRWDNPFSSDLAYPACGCYLDERLVTAGSTVQPATLKSSAVGEYYNFDEITMPDDADPVEATLASRKFEQIHWLVPLERLVVGTSESLWMVTGSGDGPLTPSSIYARPRSSRGSASLQGIAIGQGVLYVVRGGQQVRDFSYLAESAQWGGADLSILSEHLLQGYTIVDWAYAETPLSTVWIVRSDGALLSLTFMREEKVWAWGRHDSGGDVFEAVTVVSNGQEDVPFFVVKRTINGQTKRYIERLATRFASDSKQSVFLDCAKSGTMSGNTIPGLSHLEGRVVGVLADGLYRGTYTVTSGSVTFTGASATRYVVGLPIVADWEALDFPQGRDLVKTVETVAVEARCYPALQQTAIDGGAGVYFGQSLGLLGEVRKFSDWLDSNYIGIMPVETTLNPGGRCAVRHTQPYPLEILAVTREVA